MAAEALGLPDWFTAQDARPLKLQDTAEAHRGGLVEVLGISPGKAATGTLRALLRAFGYRLESRQIRVDGARPWHYGVIPQALP